VIDPLKGDRDQDPPYGIGGHLRTGCRAAYSTYGGLETFTPGPLYESRPAG